MPYGLTDIELQKLLDVFVQNEKIDKVVHYGSRAKGNFKPFSDVDLTLVGSELSRDDLNKVILEIDDLLLPYQFDVSLKHKLKNAALIDHIERRGVEIYKKENWGECKLK